jgi:hypothetical protein
MAVFFLLLPLYSNSRSMNLSQSRDPGQERGGKDGLLPHPAEELRHEHATCFSERREPGSGL